MLRVMGRRETIRRDKKVKRRDGTVMGRRETVGRDSKKMKRRREAIVR